MPLNQSSLNLYSILTSGNLLFAQLSDTMRFAVLVTAIFASTAMANPVANPAEDVRRIRTEILRPVF